MSIERKENKRPYDRALSDYYNGNNLLGDRFQWGQDWWEAKRQARRCKNASSGWRREQPARPGLSFPTVTYPRRKHADRRAGNNQWFPFSYFLWTTIDPPATSYSFTLTSDATHSYPCFIALYVQAGIRIFSVPLSRLDLRLLVTSQCLWDCEVHESCIGSIAIGTIILDPPLVVTVWQGQPFWYHRTGRAA